MSTQRNQEYQDAVVEQKFALVDYFVDELEEALDDIGATLDDQSHVVLLNWVRDRVRVLHKDFKTNE